MHNGLMLACMSVLHCQRLALQVLVPHTPQSGGEGEVGSENKGCIHLIAPYLFMLFILQPLVFPVHLRPINLQNILNVSELGRGREKQGAPTRGVFR